MSDVNYTKLCGTRFTFNVSWKASKKPKPWSINSESLRHLQFDPPFILGVPDPTHDSTKLSGGWMYKSN